ncbi:MAG: tRNA (adenosine(37)-N6)-dimethylallyltransferase MiaA [Candidatus Magasanikbacteria bacterium CG_4_10_14_0_2_um_filter_33_14]|uniref:tRNA dimethylallyltransferase n=1 Tax=Candidatus Magasanikbacteria bacterium CG_4_10_14_0_2_um_filter_33_14 TaxID=1974636 RepID=A0A2M7VAL6_9BACT|nr:MAG: tRNA (adenosine(37)-N6)-dimethylallyltransferase MiaA [Candidatus Magasanikbacteria bacterium CG_4_10_14_0_2_um_filter_33_14]
MVSNEHNDNKQLPKLIVILGPTASGKTEWSLHLAKKFDGEIISADSRQVFKKMDIGTAKAQGEWRRDGFKRTYYVDDVPHYMMDFLDPGKFFTAAKFHDQSIKHVKTIHRKNKNPFVVGGTGMYIQSLVDNYKMPRIPPNKKLRRSFEEKSNEELLEWLKQVDPISAEIIDQNNKRRLIRALEVSILSGEPFSSQQKMGEALFDILQIGIKVDKETIHKRIEERVDKMIENNLLKEIDALLKQKYSWDLPSMSGIGYRQFREHLEGTEELEKAINKLKKETKHFAKKQMTWFKRDKRINWVEKREEAEKLIEEFLGK